MSGFGSGDTICHLVDVIIAVRFDDIWSGSRGNRRGGRCAVCSRLGIIQLNILRSANRPVTNNVVNTVIDAKGKVREENVGTDVVKTEGATTGHGLVLPQRIQWSTKTGDVESVPNHDNFSIETEHGSALTKDGEFGIIPKKSKPMEALAVGGECCFVRQHEIGCT